MCAKKYKPKIDKLFWILLIPTDVLCAPLLILPMIFDDLAVLFITFPTFLFVNYFLFSPLFGCVELREDSVFIKYGFILKREIDYSKIRAIEKERRFYSDSMMSLKCALDHVNIKYNSFDVTTVSVDDNDVFVKDLEERMKRAKECQLNQN